MVGPGATRALSQPNKGTHMKIESIIRRKAGTNVKLDDTNYHFAAGDDGAHVAEVTDPAHVKRLLGIPEGFREYGQAQADANKPKAAESGDDEPTDYLITTDDGGELDLGKLSKAELVAFAKANKIKIDARGSEKDILTTVFDAVTAD